MSENIRVSEVSDILSKQLEGINTNVQLYEIGTVRQMCIRDRLCTADVGRDQRKCQLLLLRFVRQVGGGSILFAYRLQGEGVVPECCLLYTSRCV